MREELINEILSFQPNFISFEELSVLSDEELKQLYDNNRFFSNYQNIIRQQKVSVINYVYDNVYSKVYLYSLEEEQLNLLYLNAIKMTQDEFDKMVQTKLEEFRATAIAEGNDAYISFTEEEQIIASGAITPDNLLTEEEFITKSTLFRIYEINAEINALKEDNEDTEKLIEAETNYMAVTEYRNDITSNNFKIARLEQELKSLINANSISEEESKKRQP